MAQLVLANILAGSGNVLAGGDNSGNVNKVTIGSNLTLTGGVLSATGGGSGSVTSVAVTRSGDAISITGSPITTSGTINIGFAGTGAQYIKGDGTLATFPTTISQAQKLITEVYNETGATLTKGTVVYINGGHGNLPTVTKAIATGDATSAQTYGVVQSDITNNNNGFVVVIGSLIDMDTQSYTAGTQLYLSPTTAGAYTSVKQYAPAHLVYVGIVVRSHPIQGVIEIRIQNGFELDELHNVSAQTPSNGDILQYNSTTSLWTSVAGTTTNIAEGTNLYFTNARARGVLSTNVGSALSYNSTTGRFTLNAADSGTDGYLTAADWTDFDSKQASLGTGTTSQFLRGDLTWAAPAPISLDQISDVDYVGTPSTGQLLRYRIDHWENWTPTYVAAGFFSATSPLAYNSTTGVFSISQANTTTSGYLSSTDWNTFNNKQASGNYITDLTGEATASGPGSVAITLTNSAVIGKVLTGLNVTGGSVAATDSILTAFGKVQNQINGLIGGSIYKGTWNASTNTPALASSVGTAGWYYIVSVAGSTNLNGITDWNVGDWAIFNGGVWQKVDNTDSVVSVNGFTGAVSLTTDNISEGATNLYYTSARARSAVSANPGSALTYNSSTGRFTLNAADGTTEGYVTAADYNYWDSKQDSLGTGTTSQWLRGDLTWSTVPAPALDDLTDVTITTPSNGQLLRYQAGTWINFTPTYIVAGYLSATAPLSYNSGTGVFSISLANSTTNGYLSSTDWNTFNSKQSALTFSSPLVNTSGTITINQATTSTSGYLSSTDWNTFNNKQSAITLTTTGTSGTATFVGSTLNIPQYQAVLTNPVTGTGTTNKVPKFNGTSTVTDSSITDAASTPLVINKDSSSITNSIVSIYPTTGTNASILNLDNSGAGSFYIGRQNSAGASALLAVSAYDSVVGHTGSQTLHLVTGATSRIAVFGDGNIGVGTTTNAGYKLDISGTARYSSSISFPNGSITSSGELSLNSSSPGIYTYGRYSGVNGGRIFFNNGTGANLFFGEVATHIYTFTANASTSPAILAIDALNTRIGIKTNSPSSTLHVYNSTAATTSTITVENTVNNYNSDIKFTSIYGGSTSKSYLIGSNVNVGSGSWEVYDATNPATRFIISSTGNVGIGVNAANLNGSKLFVAGNYFSMFDTSAIRGISIFASQSSTYHAIYGDYSGGGSFFPISISSRQTQSDFYLFTNGNIAIGSTTDAGYKLDVNGNGRYSGKLNINTNGFNSVNQLNVYGAQERVAQFMSGGDSTIIVGGTAADGASSGEQYITYQNGTTNTNAWMVGMDDGEDWRFAYGAQGEITDANTLVRLTQGGNFLVGTITDAGYKLYISGSVGSTGGFFEASDKRLKKELKENPIIDGISDIKPKLYIKDGKEELGYYAQELEQVLPSSVSEGKDGFLSLSYTQVHTAKIAQLEGELNELKQIVKNLINELGRNSK